MSLVYGPCEKVNGVLRSSRHRDVRNAALDPINSGMHEGWRWVSERNSAALWCLHMYAPYELSERTVRKVTGLYDTLRGVRNKTLFPDILRCTLQASSAYEP